MPSTHEQKLQELKKKLKQLQSIEHKNLETLKKRQEIHRLKRQIREKKFAGLRRTGKNLKVIGKEIGKQTAKFIGEDPIKKPGSKVKTVEQIMKELPQ